MVWKRKEPVSEKMKDIVGYAVNTFRYGSENRSNPVREVDLHILLFRES